MPCHRTNDASSKISVNVKNFCMHVKDNTSGMIPSKRLLLLGVGGWGLNSTKKLVYLCLHS